MSNPIKRAVIACDHLPSAILLLRIHYWGLKRHNSRGWVRNSYQQWQEETGLTTKQTKDGLQRLRKKGLIETRAGSLNGMRTHETRLSDTGRKVFEEPVPEAQSGTIGKSPEGPTYSEGHSEGLSPPSSKSEMSGAHVGAHEGTGEGSGILYHVLQPFTLNGKQYKPGEGPAEFSLEEAKGLPVIDLEVSGAIVAYTFDETAKHDAETLLKEVYGETPADPSSVATYLVTKTLSWAGEKYQIGSKIILSPAEVVALAGFITKVPDLTPEQVEFLKDKGTWTTGGYEPPAHWGAKEWAEHDKKFPGPPYPAGHPKLVKAAEKAALLGPGTKPIDAIVKHPVPIGQGKTFSFAMDDMAYISPSYMQASSVHASKTFGANSIPPYIKEYAALMGPIYPPLNWNGMFFDSLPQDAKQPLGSIANPLPGNWPHPGLLKALKAVQPGEVITIDYDKSEWKLSVPLAHLWPPIHCREHAMAAVVCKNPWITDLDLAGEDEWGYWTPAKDGTETIYWTKRPRSHFTKWENADGTMGGMSGSWKPPFPGVNPQQVPKPFPMVLDTSKLDPEALEALKKTGQGKLTLLAADDPEMPFIPYDTGLKPESGMVLVSKGDGSQVWMKPEEAGLVALQKPADLECPLCAAGDKAHFPIVGKKCGQHAKTKSPPGGQHLDYASIMTEHFAAPKKIVPPPKIESIPLTPKTIPIKTPPEDDVGSVFDVLKTKGKKAGKVLPHEKLDKEPVFDPTTKPKDLAKLFRLAWEKHPEWGYLAPFPSKDIFSFKHMITRCPPGKAAVVVARVLADWTGFCIAARDNAGAYTLPAKPTVAFLLRYIDAAVNFALPPELKAQAKQFAPKPKVEEQAKPVQTIAQDVDKPASLAEVQAILGSGDE